MWMLGDEATVKKAKEIIEGCLGGENEWIREMGRSMTKKEV